MYTGIVEELGTVAALSDSRVRIYSPLVVADARIGDSLSVNGCCLTVVARGDDWWEADLSPETLRLTNLSELGPTSAVNLERPVAVGSRLGGHIVQGHVDGVGTVVEPVPDLRVRVPVELRRYLVHKGSVTVNGVSLTIASLHDDGFSVAVIPHTAEVTNLGTCGPGTRVNLEVDVIARYVERLLGSGTESTPGAIPGANPDPRPGDQHPQTSTIYSEVTHR